jgi:UDP-glucose 4-epimerase
MIKKKILIIGGTGFLGHHLAKKCNTKFIVTSLSLNLPKKEKKIKGVRYLIADISKKQELIKKINSKFDIVVNLGGYINHKNRNLAIKTHLNGCKNLINFFKDKNIELFIQIGSSAEYGKQKSPNFENMKCSPKTIYAQSKLNASKYLINFPKKYNFPYVILRFYQVYGPEQKQDRLIPMVINSCLEDLHFRCTSGIQSKDFLYITDAINAICKCFNNNKIISNIINIGSGHKISVRKLILKVVKNVGYGKPMFGVLGKRSDEPKNSYPSIKKAKKILIWKPKISLEKGLRMTVSYYKNKKNEL